MIISDYKSREAVLYGLLTEAQQKKVNSVCNGSIGYLIDKFYVFYKGYPYIPEEYLVYSPSIRLPFDFARYWEGYFPTSNPNVQTLIHDNENGTYVFGTFYGSAKEIS